MSISILTGNNRSVCFGFIRAAIFTSFYKGNVHYYWCRHFRNMNNGQVIEKYIPFGRMPGMGISQNCNHPIQFHNPILCFVSFLFLRMLGCRFRVWRVRNQRMHSIWGKTMRFQTEWTFLYCCFYKEHTIILMVYHLHFKFNAISYVIWCIWEMANTLLK